VEDFLPAGNQRGEGKIKKTTTTERKYLPLTLEERGE